MTRIGGMVHARNFFPNRFVHHWKMGVTRYFGLYFCEIHLLGEWHTQCVNLCSANDEYFGFILSLGQRNSLFEGMDDLTTRRGKIRLTGHDNIGSVW